ncbi:MAG: type III-A CRISPR-associated RAMP protein Csm4 [Caldilineaceae bacterium]
MRESLDTSLSTARYTRVTLCPRGPFHFGKRGVGLNETEIAMPADSFFSALCNAISDLHGATAVDAFLNRFPAVNRMGVMPPLRITSLMPYLSERRTEGTNSDDGQNPPCIYLLPMPLLHVPMGGDPIANRKRLKSIRWLSTAVFERLISGEPLSGQNALWADAHNERKATPYTVERGSVWLTASEYAHTEKGRATRLWDISIRPRVTVDRVTGASAVYSSGSVSFAKGAGLYLYIQWAESADEKLRQQVLSAVQYLGDAGIGGERTYGYGHFTPHFAHFAQLPIQQPPHATHIITLAPYLPQPAERAAFTDDQVCYDIVLRRGWLTLPGYSNLRRPTVRMVDTGAILAASEAMSLTGYLADATPVQLTHTAYTIYRYGICWPISVALPPKPAS